MMFSVYDYYLPLKIILFKGRGPEMKRCGTWFCQTCDRDFLTRRLGCLEKERPEIRKLEMSLYPKTQCMQITSCLKPLDATIPENNVT